MKGRRGFTLLEVIIAIAVISILAAIAVPYVAGVIDQTRRESTRKEMEGLYDAIMGNPQSPTAGFAGDMGRLPTALSQLNTRGGQPGGTTGALGVNVGWFGPYVNSGFDPGGYLSDPWGTNYRYGAAPDGPGQVRSAGPDRNFLTADDIVYPPNPVNIYGRLLVNLYVWSVSAGQFVTNPQPAANPGMTASATFYYSNSGSQATSSITLPPAGGPPYSFNGFHAGLHAVTATCTLPGNPGPATGQAVVYVPGNNQQAQLNLYLR
ncbi:MAG: type II secretion system protein GspG [Deltaproteobacteria bacterium]|nr:type II secretion system protein GspG [Deltaproteobacteria bacterium]